MRKYLLSVITFVFAVCALSQASEAANLKSAVIGKWVKIKSDGSYGEQLEFLKDGTLIIVEEGSSQAGDYKFIDDNRLRFDAKLGTKVFEVVIDKQGQMLLIDPAGKIETYITKGEVEKREKIKRAKIEKERAEEEKRLKRRITDNGNSTVTDNETGLIWTKDGNMVGRGLGSWSEAVGFIEGMNIGKNRNYGYTDWRLPTKDELLSLINSNILNVPYSPFTNVKISEDLAFGGKRVLFYWSSSATTDVIHRTIDGAVETVSVYEARVSQMSKRFINTSGDAYVWPVRGGHDEEIRIKARKEAEEQRKEYIKTRFQFSEVALDDTTKLMWAKDANIAGKDMTWNEAFEFIKQLNGQKYAGFSDWRLPTKEELETLPNLVKAAGVEGKINELFNKSGFRDVQASRYWSSTTYTGGKGNAWNMDMENGNVSFGYKGSNYYVWPVRSGQ